MLLSRKQFLNIAGPGALGAAAQSAWGSPGRAEATENRNGGAVSRTDENRFSFKANAVAFGGQMKDPYPDLLEVQAATTLPPSGGHGSAHAENYIYGQFEKERYIHIASFTAAHAEVFGGQKTVDKVTRFETSATVTMTGIKIGDEEENLIAIKKIVGQLTSVVTSGSETPIRHVESRIDGLTINGQEVKLTLHDGLFECETFGDLMRRVKKGYEAFRPPVLNHKGEVLQAPEGWKEGMPYPDVMLKTSVFKEPANVSKPLTAIKGGCRIKVGEWILTLGELEITPQSRRLTMLRVDMGPNRSGTIVMAAVEGNGRPF